MTNEQNALFLASARRCLNTPFHHQGRAPDVGLDCIGLVVIALHAIGFTVADRTDYGIRPDGTKLVDAIRAHGGQSVHQIAAGDVLVFRYDDQPQHVAIATGPDTMIHSFAPANRVVESGIGAYWRRRLMAIYRF